MISAEAIAKSLGGKRLNDGSWMARCPAHDDHDPSLHATDDKGGGLLVHCFAGCSQPAVIDALRRLGLWPSTGLDRRPSRRVQWRRP